MDKNTILIVEDDPVSALVARKSLELLGYDVSGVFESAEEALPAVARLRPDLVLMDIVLAGEMDGVRAAQLIRQRHGVPVIYLTSTTDEMMERVGTSGACGYIHKPVKVLDLKANVEMALARGALERQLHWANERKAVLDALPLAALLASRELAVAWANVRAEGLLGLTVEDMAGRPATDVLGQLFDLPEDILSSASLEGREKDMTIADREGALWHVQVRPVPGGKEQAGQPESEAVEQGGRALPDGLAQPSGAAVFFSLAREA